MIKRALGYMFPAAFFAAWIWFVMLGIEPMVSRENNNRFHAMLLGCKYIGSTKDVEKVLYFDCADRIELHKEIDWAVSTAPEGK
jgi:hypothetical protein